MESEKQYKCNICDFVFADPSGLRKHGKRKTSCVPKDPSTRNLTTSEIIHNKLNSFEQKIKTLEEENLRLKTLEEENLRLKHVVDNIQELKSGIDRVEEKILLGEERRQLSYLPICNNYNNCLVQNTTNNNNKNKNLNFTIQLATNDHERYDHIPKEQVLHILDQSDFSRSVGDLVEAVHFNPKAPENMTWCVDDKTSEQGALAYDHESNCLFKCKPCDVITKSLQNILFGMSDVFEELREAALFNDQQGKNYQTYFNLIGQDSFQKEYINSIKTRAYEGRYLTKAIWGKLHIGVAITKVQNRQAIKNIKTI